MLKADPSTISDPFTVNSADVEMTKGRGFSQLYDRKLSAWKPLYPNTTQGAAHFLIDSRDRNEVMWHPPSC